LIQLVLSHLSHRENLLDLEVLELLRSFAG
jgi:hypothetical protein